MYGLVHDNDRLKGGGNVLHLIRETADGLGQLVVQHVKLAQLELAAELRAMGSRAALIAVCVLIMVGGYTLAMAGVALLIGGNRALAVPLLAIGLVHVAGTGIGLGVLFSRLRRTHLMKATTGEIAHSATALIEAMHEPAHPAARGAGLEHTNVR